MKKLAILQLLKNRVYLIMAVAVAFILFDLSYYFMSTLSGSDGLTCIDGGNLTLANLVFSAIMSLSVALMLIATIEVHKRRRKKILSAGSALSGAGFFVGTLTVFCTACTIPIISLFGLGTVLWWFVSYNLWFKLLSLVLIGLGLRMLNKQLEGECKICK